MGLGHFPPVNWLAHFVLSPDNDRVRLGNWLPDVLSRPELDRVTDPLLRQGMELHRRIDGLTDAHPAVAAARARLPASQRRFSGIILDVVWDHFLSRNFTTLTGGEIDPFVTRVEAGLLLQQATLPSELRAVLARMIGEGWLRSYGTADGVELTLSRISRRLSTRARSAFSPAAARQAIEHGYHDYEADFHRLWFHLRDAIAGAT